MGTKKVDRTQNSLSPATSTTDAGGVATRTVNVQV